MSHKIRLAVAGLGRAFTLMLPTLLMDKRFEVVAGCDPIEEARIQFECDFKAQTFKDFELMCQNDRVEAVYIATPHQYHATHVEIASRYGKHILVEKPMAITIDECNQMIECCLAAGVVLIVGHSHSFNAPILKAYEWIKSNKLGSVKLVNTFNYTDFLYRPRRPEELETKSGGGVVFSQAAHQVDIIRLLGGGRVESVYSTLGQWDPTRPTEGSYTVNMVFDNGCTGMGVYSGYGHFDSDEWMQGISELGSLKQEGSYGVARKRLENLGNDQKEAELKAARNYGGALWDRKNTYAVQPHHQHFGPLIISLEGGDIRPTPSGLIIEEHQKRWFESIPVPVIPRQEVMDEFYSAVVEKSAYLHSGQWARATLAVCLSMMESADKKLPIKPAFQISPFQEDL
jgi:phthalate 4,5-cis-dihydrodiol dehydrogenase